MSIDVLTISNGVWLVSLSAAVGGDLTTNFAGRYIPVIILQLGECKEMDQIKRSLTS